MHEREKPKLRYGSMHTCTLRKKCLARHVDEKVRESQKVLDVHECMHGGGWLVCVPVTADGHETDTWSTRTRRKCFQDWLYWRCIPHIHTVNERKTKRGRKWAEKRGRRQNYVSRIYKTDEASGWFQMNIAWSGQRTWEGGPSYGGWDGDAANTSCALQKYSYPCNIFTSQPQVFILLGFYARLTKQWKENGFVYWNIEFSISKQELLYVCVT